METCPTGGLPLENSNGKPKYDGVTVYMDGKEWVVPALSVRQFRQHYQTLLDSDITPENYPVKMAERLSIVLAAMQRNYPEITEEQLLDMIDAVSTSQRRNGRKRIKTGWRAAFACWAGERYRERQGAVLEWRYRRADS
jgi:hypothetical protein